MAHVRPLVAGNWKMNGLKAALAEVASLRAGIESGPAVGADVMICPATTLLAALAAEVSGSAILSGGQDCHTAESGAHTGDISAEMLADAGASAVIVGHSERRTDHGEGDDLVRAKAVAAYRAGLTAIVCVGETAAQRENGETINVVTGQLTGSVPDAATAEDTVIAYEPVWAIGTGLTPTPADVAEVPRGHSRCIAGPVRRRTGVRLSVALWRFCEARQRSRAHGCRKRERCVGRRCKPESRRFPWNSRCL